MGPLVLLGCHADPVVPDLPPQHSGTRLTPLRVWSGDEAYDAAGEQIAVGDPDRDGRADIVIGAPSTFVYGPDAVWSHAGVYRTTLESPSGVLEEVALGTLIGEKNGDSFGSRVAFVDDVTGDGFDDIAIQGLVHEGPIVAHIVFADPLIGTKTWHDHHSGYFIGSADRESASDIASCGDLDGDGASDLCLGNDSRPFGVEAGERWGKVHLFRGPVESGFVALGSADVELVGLEHEVGGFSLAGGVDLTGDGLPELLVGADDREDRRGGVFVVSDPPDGVSEVVDYPLWAGTESGEQAGLTSVGGDLDGDGTADLFIGAHPGNRGYVVTHPRGGTLGTDAALLLTGTEPLDWFGADAAIGDFDADGDADLAVGIPRNIYGGFDQPGRVAIYLGPLPAGEATEADADLVFRGSELPDAFGLELAAGDTDGDGDDDLVVGAPYDSARWEQAGAVYLFDPIQP